MTLKEYLKEWDESNKKFKTGDFVKIVGFNKDVEKNIKGDFLGKFGVIEEQDRKDRPDFIIFVSKKGKQGDEADFANKFILKPAKKCEGCGTLFAIDELKNGKTCKHCS